ncbi:hypothetical protein BLNAU_6603 [Blattamonas nauphoetae]|uniref:Uncharacterized protein n=1 Tax=Blattamonas nauphoetae TaxID=2049346 RepID=A0ABQ9Y3L0_9EUKA|nr:hypothetical protein BLNAU_6603 [Blattamonas nauphoetae]
MECTFQPAFSVRSGQLVIESLSFTTNPEFDAYPPIQLIGESLVDESENEVAMEVDYFGDRGWIEVEGDTTTSTYPDLKLKKWTFRGSSSPKKSHGLWLKNVGIVELTRCSFSSFKKGSEATIVDGSAIHAELCSSSSLTITESSFNSCSSLGNGGAIFVDLSSLGAGSYSLTSLTFASSCTSSGHGKWVFIQGHNLASLVTKERWAGTFESLNGRSDANKLWGLDLAKDESSSLRSVSLLHFLLGTASRTPDSTVFVGQHGKDEIGCGETKATLCRTIEWSLTDAADSVIDIVVTSNSVLSSPIVLLNADVQIAPDSGRLCPFVVSLENPSSAPASMIRVERDSALALSFLSFSFSVHSSLVSVIYSSFVFKSSAFVLSDCHSLSVEGTKIADNSFNTSFLVGSLKQLRQTGLIHLRAINPSHNNFRSHTFSQHLLVFLRTFTNNPNSTVRLCLVRVPFECDSREHHVLSLLWQPNSPTGGSCEVDKDAASSLAAKGFSMTL